MTWPTLVISDHAKNGDASALTYTAASVALLAVRRTGLRAVGRLMTRLPAPTSAEVRQETKEGDRPAVVAKPVRSLAVLGNVAD